MNKEKNNELYNIVCARIKNVCKELYIPQKDIAKAIGLSNSQYENKITNCGAKFNLYELRRLSEELLIPLDELTAPEVQNGLL